MHNIPARTWSVYLGGEVHSDWRDEIARGVEAKQLPVSLCAPVTDHAASDACGVRILGDEPHPFWHDHKGAKINAIRTRTLIDSCDIAVIRFAGEYREWNAGFDAGYAAARGKPLIVIHPDELRHALKEVDGAAMAVARTAEQVLEILEYVTMKR